MLACAAWLLYLALTGAGAVVLLLGLLTVALISVAGVAALVTGFGKPAIGPAKAAAE